MTDRLVDFSLNRRVTVAMLAITLLLFGGIALKEMRFTLLPQLEYPTMTVRSELPGAGPEEVEALLIRPMEESLGVIKGLKRIDSSAIAGQADVRLEFGWDADMKQAAYEVRDRLGVIQLPLEASPPILLRFNPGSEPILRLALLSEEKSIDLKGLRNIAEKILKNKLEPIAGVAAVQVSGGLEEEIQVLVDQYKLAQLGLSVEQIARRLKQENVNLSGGAIRQGTQQFLVRTVNQFDGLDDIENLVVLIKNGVPVRLRDVAQVVSTHKDRTTVNRLDGRETIEVAVYKEGDANAVQVADAVKSRLADIRGQLPFGVRLQIVDDQSVFISQAVDTVIGAAALGGVLAVLVIYLFLRDMRATAVIATLIPVSVVAGFFFMYQSGISLNVMSLGGIALAIGLLVDNGIVVLENIAGKRAQGLPVYEAVRHGTREVGGAIFASTLTTVAVFLPLIFVTGIAGQLFKDQALTVTFTLLVSLFIALTVLPMLSSLGAVRNRSSQTLAANGAGTVDDMTGRVADGAACYEPGADSHPRTALGALARRIRRRTVNGVFNVVLLIFVIVWHGLARLVTAALYLPSQVVQRSLRHIADGYDKVLPWALKHRLLVVALVMFTLVLSMLLLPRLGMNLIPDLDENRVTVKFRLPEGSTIEAADSVLAAVSGSLSETDEVEFVFGASGYGSRLDASIGPVAENTGEAVFRLAPGVDKTAFVKQVLTAFRAHPGVQAELERGAFFELPKAIEVELTGYDLETLQDDARRVASHLETIPGLVNLDSGVRRGQPEVRIHFDQEKLAALGLKVREVADVVVNRIRGKSDTRVHWQDRKIDILVRAVDEQRRTVEDLSQLIINPGADVPITLGSVAVLETGESPGRIQRRDQSRVVVVSGDLDGSRDLADVSADIQEALRSVPLHPQTHWQLAGQNREMQQSYQSLLFALGLAVFLVYMVLASQFESLLHPFVILLTVPLALAGVIWALFLTGTPVSVIVFIGAIMLVGIVVNNAIVFIDLIKQLQTRGLEIQDAIIQAGRQRLRPILMTTVTTVFGLLPMVLVSQAGAEIRQPMAITVIGGLLVSTVLTLVVVPVVYSLLSPRWGRQADKGLGDTESPDGEISSAKA